MYKVIIVDDEDEVREGIINKTNWESCGFELVGDYSNGQDAFIAIERDRPDAVITDINMPFMDGLELSEKVKFFYRDTKVVIVTGYDEFEYARQAIKLKVNDYLLKPFNAKEFTDFLLKMRTELDEEREKHEDLNQLRIQLNQSLPLLKERFLEKLVHSDMNNHEINRKFEFFQISLDGPAYLSLVVDMDPIEEKKDKPSFGESELLRFAVFNIFQEIFETENAGIVFQTRDDKIGILLSGSPKEIELKAQTLSEHARQSVEKYLKFTVSVGIGRMNDELKDLSKSFQEALSALDYRFLLGENKIISIHDLEAGTGMNTLKYNDLEKKLLSSIKSGNDSGVSEAISEWVEQLKYSFSSVDRSYSSIHKLIATLMNQIAETGFDEREVFDNDPFSQITSMKTLDEVQHWLNVQCRKIIEYLNDKRIDVSNSQMKLAESYIRDQYSDPNFSLKHVCDHIYMSISYFSALFKQYSGETFVEFLTRVRMEKAKDLLNLTDIKIYEIASKVGYGESQYFSVIFKRHTGMTPKEYRSSRKGNISNEH
jgi:two-component system response regulator YesN